MILENIQKKNICTKDDLTKEKNAVCQTLHINTFPDAQILETYFRLREKGEFPDSPNIERLLQKRSIRTLSGIAPISVLMPPAPCNSACVYCPSERVNTNGKTLFQIDTEKKYGKQNVPKKYQKPGALAMPKSYISSEPGAMRALLAGFDPFVQITRRIAALNAIGHCAEKCELIVQGGTFSDLDKRTRTRFITRCYQACNAGEYQEGRSPRDFGATLQEAQKQNETAKYRVIGLTLETRPGSITPEEVREFRKLGCTRVEIGVQTLDDEVTRKTRRIQTRQQVVRGTRLLREAGFKICYHVMPGLPFSTPEKDLASYREICTNPDFCPDLVKIYPCSVVPFSELKKWFETGKYVPYSQQVLFDLLKEMKKITPPWIRISRLIRDIPSTAIIGGSKTTNLRQLIQEDMKKHGEECVCIRCREVRDQSFVADDIRFVSRRYVCSGGVEHFLSYECGKHTLLAMLRLFLPDEGSTAPFRALQGRGIVRELHAFGNALSLEQKNAFSAQHTGLGTRLLRKAQEVSIQNGKSGIAVISGIGVKGFYRSRGLRDMGTYVVQ